MVALADVSVDAAVSGAALSTTTEQALATSTLLYVATQRKSGARSTVRPIWFNYEGGTLYFTTSPSSWKARRLARGSPLYIWVGSESGPFLIGHAERINDRDTIARMGEEYARKYWIARLGFFRPDPDRVSAGKTIAYRVTIEEADPGRPPG